MKNYFRTQRLLGNGRKGWDTDSYSTLHTFFFNIWRGTALLKGWREGRFSVYPPLQYSVLNTTHSVFMTVSIHHILEIQWNVIIQTSVIQTGQLMVHQRSNSSMFKYTEIHNYSSIPHLSSTIDNVIHSGIKLLWSQRVLITDILQFMWACLIFFCHF